MRTSTSTWPLLIESIQVVKAFACSSFFMLTFFSLVLFVYLLTVLIEELIFDPADQMLYNLYQKCIYYWGNQVTDIFYIRLSEF
ncbi:hypothetical protein ABIE26_002441 [Pedobacter africanus]|uniref:Uncharacterized protein n=1 Tax=Pedobacter africanus TaxID=151894 RepID=A0ACC6KYC5_9SPHI|nr:hypothetical protein [Pedobacter africanus]